MKRFLSNHWKAGLTLLFGLVVFLFWRYRYPFALTYQEQFQLFLFDDDYLAERLAEPGGMARYIGEFLTQFYNSVTLGALILAVLLMLVQRLTWRLMHTTRWYSLSFLPSIILWYAMGDESVLLGYVVALILAMLLAYIYSKCNTFNTYNKSNKYARAFILVVLMPIGYWLLGPMVVLTALLVSPWWLAGMAVTEVLACVLLTAHFLPFPVERLLLGIGYYRFPVTLPYVLMAVPVVIAVLGRLGEAFKGCLGKGGEFVERLWVRVAALAVVAVLGLLLIPRGFDARKYELIEYDYLVRIKDWNGVIRKASEKTPDLPMSVSATNLALAMTNQLGERAFDFYQRGSEGLLPNFERNFTTAQLTGEIYFHLGLVNTAQRFAFESMEALPDYSKSARAVKRLAETNLINGEYDVARKYLQMLQKTIFYRPWAQRTMEMLGQERLIDSHPLYGTLRQYRLPDDFLFSEQELDKICGQLFMHNQQNQMAAQYLLMAPLLDADLSRFMQYVPVVQNRISYNPRAVQEGIAFAFMQQRQPLPQGVVSPMIQQQMQEFSRLYSQGGSGNPALQRYRNTAWYYLIGGK